MYHGNTPHILRLIFNGEDLIYPDPPLFTVATTFIRGLRAPELATGPSSFVEDASGRRGSHPRLLLMADETLDIRHQFVLDGQGYAF